MTYLKIVQYMYLVFAAFFIYDAYAKALAGENYWLSVIIALVAIGMFFFRRHFHNKYQNKQ